MAERFLANYKQVGTCGVGGNGSVDKYQHKETGQLVALKSTKLHPENLAHKDRDEISILRQLQHPGLVKLVAEPYSEQVGVDEILYLPLECCEGGCLSQLSVSSLRYELIQRIAYQVATALFHMHSKQIMHRDIKADNILLTCANLNRALVKICDFGQARRFDPETLAPHEDPEMPKKLVYDEDPTLIFGSNAAPEVETGRYTCKCDVWSFGLLVHNLAYGMKEGMSGDRKQKHRVANPKTPLDHFINSSIEPEISRPDISEVLRLPFFQSYRDHLIKRLRLRTSRNMILRTHFPDLAGRFIQETISDIDDGVLAYVIVPDARGIPDPQIQELKTFNKVLMDL